MKAPLSLIVGACVWSSTATATNEAGPPSIWYRSAEGCPNGEAFIARLHGAAEGSKLAEAADQIDFVVTLGLKGDRFFGRLERQTAEGRAAIRELKAPSCEEVADALALTLTLTLDPQAPTSPATEAPAPLPPAPAVASAPVTGGPAANPGRPEPVRQVRDELPTPRWLAGAQLTANQGSLPEPLPGARLFVELEAATASQAPSVRLALFGSKRLASNNPEVDLLLVGGRLDACPLALFGPAVELRPCLALDVGSARARGTGRFGVSDTGAWVAASASARAAWHVSRLVSLEAELGPNVPLTRYELLARETATPLHRTEVIGLSAAAGLTFRLR